MTTAEPASEAPVEEADPVFDAFESVCVTLHAFQAPTDPTWADGYLMAIAASRRLIATEEWLPTLAGDAFERAFGDPQAALTATQALEAWLQRLRDDLDPERLLDHPDQCFVSPLFDEWTDEARAELKASGELSDEVLATLHSGSIWADGFLSAVDDFADDWPRPRDDDDSPDAEGFRAMLQLMDVLRSDPQDEAVKAFGAAQWKGGSATREEMLDETCFAVQDLRLYWLDHGPKPEQRRVEATPGRNDPCPCGSGKKYKKCHGAMA